jgi:hypothetical protein
MRDLTVKVQVTGETHFPTFCAVKTSFTVIYKGFPCVRTFWIYFIDGYEAKHAFCMN